MLKFKKIALPEVIKRIKHYIPKRCLHIASPRKFYFQLLSQLRRTNTKLSKLMHLLSYRCNAFLNIRILKPITKQFYIQQFCLLPIFMIINIFFAILIILTFHLCGFSFCRKLKNTGLYTFDIKYFIKVLV